MISDIDELSWYTSVSKRGKYSKFSFRKISHKFGSGFRCHHRIPKQALMYLHLQPRYLSMFVF